MRPATGVSDIHKLGRLPAEGRDLSFDTRDISPERSQAGWLLELAARLLQMQVKQVPPQVAVLRLEFFEGQILDFGHFHLNKVNQPSLCREMNLARIGSLSAAR